MLIIYKHPIRKISISNRGLCSDWNFSFASKINDGKIEPKSKYEKVERERRREKKWKVFHPQKFQAFNILKRKIMLESSGKRYFFSLLRLQIFCENDLLNNKFCKAFNRNRWQ